MDGNYSILDQSLPQASPAAAPPKGLADSPAAEIPEETLRFPGEDGGKSLTEMAERDLNTALQLLAERARYITGASGAAIALREDGEMICHASAGPSAPELGAHLQVNSGLSGESVRTRRALRCDDADTDLRVNRESCRSLGIASVVVMPLVREQEVVGVFELLSGRAYAFEERDINALERLGEMILTAVEHAEAARRAEREFAAKPEPAPDKPEAKPGPPMEIAAGKEKIASPTPADDTSPQPAAPENKPAAEGDHPQPALLGEATSVGKCRSCGFPVSEGRSLCLDCEADQAEVKPAANPAGDDAPAFLAQLTVPQKRSWLKSHLYLIGIVLVAAITVAMLLRLR